MTIEQAMADKVFQIATDTGMDFNRVETSVRYEVKAINLAHKQTCTDPACGEAIDESKVMTLLKEKFEAHVSSDEISRLAEEKYGPAPDVLTPREREIFFQGMMYAWTRPDQKDARPEMPEWLVNFGIRYVDEAELNSSEIQTQIMRSLRLRGLIG